MNTLDLEVFGEDERRIRKSNVRHILLLTNLLLMNVFLEDV